MRHIVYEPGRWVVAKLGLGDSEWQKTFKYTLICICVHAERNHALGYGAAGAKAYDCESD